MSNEKYSPKPNSKNYIIKPTKKIAGLSQNQLADDFWKYQNANPQEDNPGFDLNGDFAGVHQSGDVYFLNGRSYWLDPSTVGEPVKREITVAEGEKLFFPIINFATAGNNIVDPPLYQDTSINDTAFFKQENDNIKLFDLTIDGKQVLDLCQAQNYRQITTDPNGFSSYTPENSIFLGTKYDNAFLAKSFGDGFYVGLNPLPVGKHTISFQGKSPNNSNQITYTINVKPFKEIQGDDRGNKIYGSSCNDDIDAFRGNDIVHGYGGDDIIDGWEGDDKLYGGDGNDIIYGAAGNDFLDGDDGNDVLAGGLGNDTIKGGDGKDRLYGGSGKDDIDGGKGKDIIFGGLGNDTIDGGAGNDIIDAVAYAESVLPYTVKVENFSKIITPGKDEIDILKGGAGADIFVLGMASGSGIKGSKYYVGDGNADYALIEDFKNLDKIQLFSTASEYSLGSSPSGLPSGVGIYTTDAIPDLVGIVQGQISGLNLSNTSQFTFVI
jgi:Ca2+-binding RTX toxin-like protein